LRIRAGYDIGFICPQDVPMLLLVSVHPSRAADLLTPGPITFSPAVPVRVYRDNFGNDCTRLVAPAGGLKISTRFDIHDSGLPDDVNWQARQWPVESLPDDTMLYLLGSRYCETDRLSDAAWSLFGGVAPGWARVQAICDFVHRHIRFDYQCARATRTAADAYQEGVGVCRDYAHLAIAFCRCMNIPARYCTGYLGDIGVPPLDAPGDFSAWFEAFLDGRWYTFDARHNVPRIGRILMARGRDATDVAISNTFGSTILSEFFVMTDEVPG
jgi:transglutaminase-like putative cysteine protease